MCRREFNDDEANKVEPSKRRKSRCTSCESWTRWRYALLYNNGDNKRTAFMDAVAALVVQLKYDGNWQDLYAFAEHTFEQCKYFRKLNVTLVISK